MPRDPTSPRSWTASERKATRATPPSIRKNSQRVTRYVGRTVAASSAPDVSTRPPRLGRGDGRVGLLELGASLTSKTAPTAAVSPRLLRLPPLPRKGGRVETPRVEEGSPRHRGCGDQPKRSFTLSSTLRSRT